MSRFLYLALAVTAEYTRAVTTEYTDLQEQRREDRQAARISARVQARTAERKNERTAQREIIDEYAPGAVRAGSMGWATCVADRCVSAIERGAAIGGTEAQCAQCGELARCLQDQADSNWCPPDD